MSGAVKSDTQFNSTQTFAVRKEATVARLTQDLEVSVKGQIPSGHLP